MNREQRLEQALREIKEATKRQQLPITAQVYGIAAQALITEGNVVRLKPEQAEGDTGTAMVIATLDPDIDGGLHLDRELNGFSYWNVADVEFVAETAEEGLEA